MATDGKVRIGVEVDSNEAKKELSNFGNSSADAMKKLGSAVKTAVAAIATGKLTKEIITIGSTFDSTMSQVQAISGATADEMVLLTDKAKDLGKRTSFSANESAQALTYMGMAGWKTEDMLDGLEGIMNLAAASGEDLALTSDIVTDALTAFGMKASDSGKFADILASASSNANTNVAMLGESFKYIAPIAGSLGMSAEDTSVALGLMANAGIKGSQAGTALRSALTRMVKPTKQSGTAMDKLGISITNQDGSMKSMAEVMDMLRDKMGGLSEAEQAEAAAMIFGQEAMSGMLAIVNASEEDYQKLTTAINESAGAASEMAEVRLDNLAGQFTLLKSAAEGFGLDIYESVKEPLLNIVKEGTKSVSGLAEAFKIGGTKLMLESGSVMITNLLNGISQKMPELTAKAGEVVSTMINSVKTFAPQMITAGFNVITSFISGIAEQLPQLIPQGLSMVITLADALIRNLPKLFEAGAKLIHGIGEGIVNSLPMLIEHGPRIINDFADAVYKGLGKLLAAGAKMIIELGKGIYNNLPLIKQHAMDIFMAILNVMSLSKMLSLGKSLMANLGTGIKGMISSVGSTAKNLATNAINAIKGIDWVGGGGTLMQMLGRGISAMLGMLKNTALNVAKGALSAISGIDVKSIGINIIKGIMSGITSMAKTLASAALGVVKTAVNGIKSFLGIHSPSKLMENEVGHNMTAGVEVAWKADTKELEDTAKTSMRKMTDAAGEVEIGKTITKMNIPDVSMYTGIGTRAKNSPTQAILNTQTNIDTDKIKEATQDGIKEGFKNVDILLNGRKVGKGVAKDVNEYLPAPAW